MKTLLTILISLISLVGYGQNDTIVNKICQERGHVSGGYVMKTLMYCQPYIVETDSTTIMVYPACNWESYTCIRCGKYVTEKEKEQRVVIWRKED